MMDWLIAIYPTLRSIWVVWFFLLFVGMVLWVMRPSKRRDYERAGEIPLLEDDDDTAAGPARRGAPQAGPARGANGYGSI
jgi:cytochrome c oxidase cbb3-type subunit 4